MSEAVLAREGYCAMLDALLEDLVAHVRLYTNDVDPDEDTVRADFVELAGFGYQPVAIPRWTPSMLRGGVAFAVPDVVHFVFPGPTYPPGVVGYYVTAGASGPVLWAWRRPGGPFVPDASNRVLTVYIEMNFPVARAE